MIRELPVVEPAPNMVALALPSFARVTRNLSFVLLCISALAYLAWLRSSSMGLPISDFSAYWAAGQLWLQGGDPYGVGIWNVEQTLPGFNPSHIELLPFVGPPLSLPLWGALGKIPYTGAALAWGVLLVGCVAVLIILPARLAARRIRRSDAVSLLLLAVSSGPFITGVSSGQAALPAVAAVVVAVYSASRRRWIPVAFATIVAGLLKPNDALVLMSTLREAMAFFVVASSAIVSGLANVAIVHGIHPLIAYIGVVRSQDAAERTFAFQFAPAAIAYGFGMSREAAGVLGAVLAALAVTATVAAIRVTRASLVDGVALACALFPFVPPYEHEPDTVLALLPALLVVFRARGRTWALGAIGTVLLFMNPFALTQGWPGTIFAAAMATIAALQFATLAPQACRSVRFAPLTVVPLVLFLGVLAPPHRLPIWPPAVPARVVVTAGASPSAIWNAELTALQLNTQRPWVSLLRLLTLSGCACIGIAMARTAAIAPRHLSSKASRWRTSATMFSVAQRSRSLMGPTRDTPSAVKR
jgi:hypothetical protein